MTRAAGRPTAIAAWFAVSAGAFLLLVPLARAWKLAPDLGHGWAAPLLMAYLWWERWSERPKLRPRPVTGFWWAAAGAAGAVALPLRLLLTPFPLWPTLVWAYALLLAGLALAAASLLAGRPGVRWLAGPLIILAAALPWENELEQHVIFPLREGMATIAAEASNLAGHPAIAVGTSIRLGHGWVGVDEACGGIRSLEASVMLALFFGAWLRFSWKRRAALVGLGILAALLGNFLRIIFLSVRAGAGTAAFIAAHDVAGWLALTFSLALVGFTARRWTRTPGRAAKPIPSIGANREPVAPAHSGAAAWLAIVAALLLLDEAAARLWYARGAAAEATVPRWTAQFPESAADFRAEALSQEAREMLAPDRYTAATWQISTEAVVSAYYIEWQKGQVARFVPFLHNPTVCLPLAGCELEKTLGDIAVPWAGGEIPFHAFTFRRAGQELTAAFAVWDTARGRPLEKPERGGRLGWLRGRWSDVREAREDQPAQLLSVVISDPTHEQQLLPVIQDMLLRK